MKFAVKDFRQKVLGCWMGKNIGGTVGAPMEWYRQVNDITFYTQELGGNPMPNDDLDLQLLWLIALEEKGIDINARLLSEYWLLYLTPYWAEYGNSKINLKNGLVPPLSGTVNNNMKDSCGAFIRSEIWACIAPGLPGIAARYAYEDAIIDHGDGEGTYAEIFCAALESAAFVEKDIYKLIDIGLSYVPETCAITSAVKLAIECFKSGIPWLEARDTMLKKFGGSPFLGDLKKVSNRDVEKGFVNGKFGFDAPSNIGIVIIGLLYGEGDFASSICITVNCGEDTDCTAATVGAIFGIIHGIDFIPEKWIEPIGRGIKTGCLDLGELSSLGATGDLLPQDVDELTERVIKIARLVLLRHGTNVEFSDTAETDLSDYTNNGFYASESLRAALSDIRGPIYRNELFEARVEYVDGPYVKHGVVKKIRLKLENNFKVQSILNIRWYLPEGWVVTPTSSGQVFFFSPDPTYRTKEMEFELSTTEVKEQVMRCVVEIYAQGRPNTELIPIVLLNGNLL